MSNKKILAVFGATGQQGTSVINHVLAHPKLSQTYTIRGITRDTTSPKATQLHAVQGIEVVEADVSNPQSLATVLKGVHAVFAMTAPSFGPDRFEVEFEQGKNIYHAAADAGVRLFTFSTLPSIRDISSGKYTAITPFDAKAAVEKYIRSQSPSSAFVSLGMFMQNFHSQLYLNPRKVSGAAGSSSSSEEEVWAFQRPMPSHIKTPYIEAVSDVGKFVGAILSDPEKYAGKTLLASQALYTQDEIVSALVKATGKKIVYKQVSVDEFAKSIDFLGGFAEIFVEGFQAQEEYGYYGPGTEEGVAWAAEQAETQGRLTTLEEYLEKNPLQLA
ncbi:NAD(P)-binding protein [Setomelanomma holmii]|uniref:NAD(P)-binding protein n=1 Tax=Setomelanomma holmii TaxID=210430 RepID=A0A9P4LHS4_9PLEO|nr:NAD(P)-binding protein [Setomelanomma holmii]